MFRLHLFFYKQPVNKKLSLEWQIAKQFSGLNFFSLSNNKNYGLKMSGVFYCNKHNAVEFIILLKGNLPQKMYSEGNILLRNDLSFIFEFQLAPFAFSLILGDPFMVSPFP